MQTRHDQEAKDNRSHRLSSARSSVARSHPSCMPGGRGVCTDVLSRETGSASTLGRGTYGSTELGFMSVVGMVYGSSDMGIGSRGMASLPMPSMSNRVSSYGSLLFGHVQTEPRFVERTIRIEHAKGCMSAGCGSPNIGEQQSVAGSLSCACMGPAQLGSLRIRGAGADVDNGPFGSTTGHDDGRRCTIPVERRSELTGSELAAAVSLRTQCHRGHGQS